MPNVKVLQILQVGRQNIHMNLYLEFLYSIYLSKTAPKHYLYKNSLYIYVSNNTVDA